MAYFCVLTGQTPDVYLSLTEVQVAAMIRAAVELHKKGW